MIDNPKVSFVGRTGLGWDEAGRDDETLIARNYTVVFFSCWPSRVCVLRPAAACLQLTLLLDEIKRNKFARSES